MQSNQTTTSKGKWQEIKDAIRMQWSKVSEEELERTRGDVRKIGGLLRQKYGTDGADYSQQLSEIVNNLENNEQRNAASNSVTSTSAQDSADPTEELNRKAERSGDWEAEFPRVADRTTDDPDHRQTLH